MWLDGKNILIIFKKVQFFSYHRLEYMTKGRKRETV